MTFIILVLLYENNMPNKVKCTSIDSERLVVKKAPFEKVLHARAVEHRISRTQREFFILQNFLPSFQFRNGLFDIQFGSACFFQLPNEITLQRSDSLLSTLNNGEHWSNERISALIESFVYIITNIWYKAFS